MLTYDDGSVIFISTKLKSLTGRTKLFYFQHTGNVPKNVKISMKEQS